MHNQPTIPTAVIFTALTVEYQAARSHVDNPRWTSNWQTGNHLITFLG